MDCLPALADDGRMVDLAVMAVHKSAHGLAVARFDHARMRLRSGRNVPGGPVEMMADLFRRGVVDKADAGACGWRQG